MGWAVAACGGHQATKSDVIARADAICASALQDLRAADPAGGQASLHELADQLKRGLPIVEQEASALRALPRPATDRDLLNRFIAAMTSSVASYRLLATAAERGDNAGVDQGLAALQANPASTLAAQYGIRECASAGTTAISR